jgi:hypothetical protein
MYTSWEFGRCVVVKKKKFVHKMEEYRNTDWETKSEGNLPNAGSKAVELDTLEGQLIHFEVSPEVRAKESWGERLIECWWRYNDKFRGVPGKYSPEMTPLLQILVSSILGFIGIFLIAVTDRWYLSTHISVDQYSIGMLTGAYAATAVLVYEAYLSPLAQPRNVFGGYFVSSITGVTVRIVCSPIGIPFWVTGALALSLAIAVMNVTKTVHPPGGACALIAVIGGPMIHSLGYGYVATSIGGALIMLGVALLGNNLIPTRHYPQYWI